MKQEKQKWRFNKEKKAKVGLITKFYLLTIRDEFNIHIFIFPRFFVWTEKISWKDLFIK